jgi:hypothetical protein
LKKRRKQRSVRDVQTDIMRKRKREKKETKQND